MQTTRSADALHQSIQVMRLAQRHVELSWLSRCADDHWKLPAASPRVYPQLC
jgi:hypothetical protein